MQKNTNLLLVDSNPTTRNRVAHILLGAGYSISATDSAKEALRLNNEEAFDLVILEICLPDLSGIDLANELLNTSTSFMFLCNSQYLSKSDENDNLSSNESSNESINSSDILRAVGTSLSWASEFQRLKETEARYTQAIETGRVVDVVVGILMERHHLERERAFEMLRSKARSERKKLRDLAQEILDALNKINKISP